MDWLLIAGVLSTLYALWFVLGLIFTGIDRAHASWRAAHPSADGGKLAKGKVL